MKNIHLSCSCIVLLQLLSWSTPHSSALEIQYIPPFQSKLVSLMLPTLTQTFLDLLIQELS